jgi:hypothetical protein
MNFKRKCQLVLTLIFILFGVIHLPAQHKVKKVGDYSEEYLIKEWKKWLKKYPIPENAIELELVKSFPSRKMEEQDIYLWHPLGIVPIPNNRILINDQKVNKVFMFESNGNFIKTFGRPGQGPGEFGNPYTLTADSENIFVGDNSNMRINIFDFEGNLIGDLNMFKSLIDLEISENGLIYGVPRRMRPSDKLVDVFNKRGEIVNSIGDRKYGDENSNWQAPNEIKISLNENNELYMAFKFFPLVRKYAKNGELLQKYHLKHKVMQEKADMNQKKLKNRNAYLGWQVINYSIIARSDGFTILSNFPRSEFLEYDDSGKIREIYYFNYTNNEYDTFFFDFFIKEKEGVKYFYLLKTQPANEIVILRPKVNSSE